MQESEGANLKKEKFIELVSSKTGCGYVWGSQGEVLTLQELDRLINWFGREHYFLSDGTRADKWLNKQVFDCSGLIIWALQQMGLISNSADYNTDGLLSKCTRIQSREQLEAGDLVFGGDGFSTWHVGVYVGGGYVVHAQCTAIGVVKTTWSQFNSWNMYGRLKYLQNKGSFTVMLKKGDSGADVNELQEKLNKIGYNLMVDGDFGVYTEAAVKDFQQTKGLETDGIVGPATLATINQATTTDQTEEVDWKQKYMELQAQYYGFRQAVIDITNKYV